jgi:Glyoxalase-like domain
VIRWVWAVIDRPQGQFEQSAAFWSAVTGTRLSSAGCGTDGESASLLPPTGHPCLKLRGVDDQGGAHLDLAVDDVAAVAGQARRLGAEVVASSTARTSMRSPAGQPFCLVRWQGESVRPEVVGSAGQATSRLDQVCVDVTSARYDAEICFWGAMTGWDFHRGASPERDLLKPPATLPVRILVQRLSHPRPASAHLDLACSDIGATRVWHESLGAHGVRRWLRWIVMEDPVGGVYCLTMRDPQTGALPLELRGLSAR